MTNTSVTGTCSRDSCHALGSDPLEAVYYEREKTRVLAVGERGGGGRA